MGCEVCSFLLVLCVVSCPFSLSASHGNVVSARRIASVLSELGLRVSLQEGWDGGDADCLVALHGFRSEGIVKEFNRKNPARKIVVVLTGTDLYRDLSYRKLEDATALQVADALVVAQEGSLKSVPLGLRRKTQLIRKSVQLPACARPKREQEPTFALVGHLREVKNPFFPVESLANQPFGSLRLWHMGGERQLGMNQEAKAWEERVPGYQFLGELPREVVIERVLRSWALVNSSRMEGGSNAVLEAMVLGVPVLASRIEGNVGLLGQDYEGYFEEDDKVGFLSLTKRFLGEVSFRRMLVESVGERAKLFQRTQELAGWNRLLEQLLGKI